MKTVVKTWRNRLPIVSDDLSHWSSVFMWRQHHYQGKPAWSSMHSSCNFPDTPLFWFHVLVVFLFFCFFFFYQIFHFLAGMVVGGWYDEGKEEDGERWEAFPAPCSLVPAEQTCCWTLPAAPGAQAPGIRALGCSPFVLKPPRKSCFQVATDSLSQFPWSPLLIPQPAQHVCAEQPSWFS